MEKQENKQLKFNGNVAGLKTFLTKEKCKEEKINVFRSTFGDPIAVRIDKNFYRIGEMLDGGDVTDLFNNKF